MRTSPWRQCGRFCRIAGAVVRRGRAFALVPFLVTAAAAQPATQGASHTARAPQAIAPFDCARPALTGRADVQWKSDTGAITWGEWRVTVGQPRLPVLVLVVLLAPERTRLALDVARDDDGLAPWSLANAPANAALAMNAGQFTDDGPWGWVVHRGREHQAPGRGALAGALTIDTAGRWALLGAGEIQARRQSGTVREAVQSYPTLMEANGVVPQSLCSGSRAIDRTHRDARLAVGTRADGALVVAMTRFDGLGTTAGRLPLGPTTPEMIAIMRALGATRALMLDGGLSAQLMVRPAAGAAAREWPGLRRVPLALVGLPVN